MLCVIIVGLTKMDKHEQSILDEIRKPDVRWHTMTSKYGGKCIECGQGINKGDNILWTKTLGAKHETCPSSSSEDFGGITVIDDDDTPKIWKDPKKYPYSELQKITKCQCCGNDVTKQKDRYIDDDRLVCVMCFGK